MLCKLEHNQIVKYYGSKENATLIKKDGTHINVAYIVLEFIPGGELFDYVANTGPFPERIIKYFSKQILLIVQYIHS